MSVLKVTCISRSESDPEGGIDGVGGEGFYHSADEAVASINSRAHQYWAEVNGESVWIEVGYDKDGAPYLKTENEEAPGVSFLGLDECAAPEQSSSGDGGQSAIDFRADAGPQSLAGEAERLAMWTILRMLVLNRYGRDEARLNRNRQRAIQSAWAAIQGMGIEEDAKKLLHEAVTRELHRLMAAAPQR